MSASRSIQTTSTRRAPDWADRNKAIFEVRVQLVKHPEDFDLVGKELRSLLEGDAMLELVGLIFDLSHSNSTSAVYANGGVSQWLGPAWSQALCKSA